MFQYFFCNSSSLAHLDSHFLYHTILSSSPVHFRSCFNSGICSTGAITHLNSFNHTALVNFVSRYDLGRSVASFTISWSLLISESVNFFHHSYL
jgi:hypothetical protein